MISFNVKGAIYTCCPRLLHPDLHRIEASDVGYRLAKGVFWSLAGAVFSRGMMLAASILVARMLGREVFGELGIIRSTVGMFGVFAGFGLGLTATKHVAEFRQSDPERAGRIIGLSSLFALGTGGLIALVLFIFAPWLSAHTLAAPHLSGVLRVGCLFLLLNALNGAQTGALAGFEAFRTIARVNLFVGLSSFPILVGGAYFWGLHGAVWGLTLNMGVLWILNHMALRRESLRTGVPFAITDCMRELPVLWRFSLPAALSGVMVGPVVWVCNAMLVNQPNGYSEMGLFTAALAFQALLFFIGGTLNAPLLSMISNKGAQMNDKVGRVNILSSWMVGVIPAIPLLCFPEIPQMLFGKDYIGQSFKITFSIIIFYTCIMMFKQGLARTLAANNLMWWGVISNAFWGLILISSALFSVRWGASGLAVSFAIAYILNTLILVPLYYFRKLVPKGTLLSLESLLIWSVLAALVFLNIADAKLFFRSIAFFPSMSIIGLSFWRIMRYAK